MRPSHFVYAGFLTALLAACGGDADPTTNQALSPSGSETQVAEVEPKPDKIGTPPDNKADPIPYDELPLFELVEADIQMVHDAFAGKYKLASGDGFLTCEKLVNMYIERILKFNDNPQPNGGLPISAVLAINPKVLDQAKVLDELYAQDNGIGARALHCAPVLLKDNYDTFDHASTSASPSMLGHTAGVDAPSVNGLRRAGAIILGKAHQDEFAYFTLGFSGRTVLVANPYNTSQSSAGSSSGTGASLAANFALLGTGSDTCQSIRHPSSVEGLVGIRPSIGVVSRKGIFPLSHVRDTGGPMVRSVRDAALMLTAMAYIPSEQEDPNFSVDEPETIPYQAFIAENDYLDESGYVKYLDREVYGLKGRKIGILRQLGENATPAAQGTVQGDLIAQAVLKMKEAGAEIYDVYLPDYTSRGAGSGHYDVNQYFREFFRDGGQSPRRCLSSALGANAAAELNCTGLDGILETFRTGPRTMPLVVATAGSEQTAPTVPEMQAIADERAYATRVMDGIEPDTIRPFGGDPSDKALPVGSVRLDAFVLSPGPEGGRTCDFGSTTQMGSIVLPVGFDDSVGVPRGMEIFVRRFDEGNGLGIAYDFEQLTLHRKPPEIQPSPLYQDGPIDLSTIAQFNTRARQAIEAATNQAPQSYDEQTLRRILEDITGQSL